MARIGTLAALVAGPLALAACGGGGDGTLPPASLSNAGTVGAESPAAVTPADGDAAPEPSGSDSGPPTPPARPVGAAASRTETATHFGESLSGDNDLTPNDRFPGSNRYANPRADLPRSGRGGVFLIMPERGGAGTPRIRYDGFVALRYDGQELSDRLAPGWRYDNAAAWNLDRLERLIWMTANRAYLQWTRHLDYDPGPLTVYVGEGPAECEGESIACHNAAYDAVTLTTDWLEEIYDDIASGNGEDAARELFAVLTHEAGHQFGYENRHGTTDGCGGDHCHAPYGSGSIMSYDHVQGRSLSYAVTELDVHHIPDATWNGGTRDTYDVYGFADPNSISYWGVYIDHDFEVSGRTDPGSFQGNLAVTDRIHGQGYVTGRPSEGVSPPSGATWSGRDNFLGVDLGKERLGALLRADASLRYAFGRSPEMTLRLGGFEAHYLKAGEGAAKWHDDGPGHSITYGMPCSADGCAGDHAGARWYASDGGDPSGWVGGTVNDSVNEYAGSFVAERDPDVLVLRDGGRP